MMLQTSKLLPAPQRFESAQEFDAGSVMDAFRAVLGLVRRHWPLFVILPLILVSLGVAYLVVTPPLYLAQATMVIDARRVQRFQQQIPTAEEPADGVTVQTQLEVLRSDAVAAAVVKNLQLGNDPEFVRNRAELSDDEANAAAAHALVAGLSVVRVPSTYAMMIGFQSHSPEKAARIANATIEAYVTDQLDAKFQSTRRASLWLQDRLSELGTQATAADKAVADYKAKNNIVAADGRLMNEQQLSEINSQLATARAATAEAKARLDRIEDVLKQPLPDASTAEALHNEIIVRLRQQILDLQARQQLFTARYGAKHQATLNIQEQVAGMQRSIADEMGKVAESARSDYAVAQAREQALTASLDSSVTQAASTNQSMVRLRELQSNAQSSRTLYESFLQRYMDAVQQETYPATEARLITPAVPPASPYKPSRVGIIGASLIGGLLVAFGVATLRELLDGVFRSAVQVERSVGLNCLATLPRLKSGKPSRTALAARALPAEPPSPREITRPPPLHRFVIDEPFSPFAEGLRAVKIAIDLANMGKSHTVVGIASTLPNEGKSTIAAQSRPDDRPRRQPCAAGRRRPAQPLAEPPARPRCGRRPHRCGGRTTPPRRPDPRRLDLPARFPAGRRPPQAAAHERDPGSREHARLLRRRAQPLRLYRGGPVPTGPRGRRPRHHAIHRRLRLRGGVGHHQDRRRRNGAEGRPRDLRRHPRHRPQQSRPRGAGPI